MARIDGLDFDYVESEADGRALALLLSTCTPEQRKSLSTYAAIRVMGSDGNVYGVQHRDNYAGWSHQCYDPRTPHTSWCVHAFAMETPGYDEVLTYKVMIEANVRDLRDIQVQQHSAKWGNIWPGMDETYANTNLDRRLAPDEIPEVHREDVGGHYAVDAARRAREAPARRWREDRLAPVVPAFPAWQPPPRRRQRRNFRQGVVVNVVEGENLGLFGAPVNDQ